MVPANSSFGMTPTIIQGSNLLPFRLSGKGKDCGGKAKVKGRFYAVKALFLTSINAKKPKFYGQKG